MNKRRAIALAAAALVAGLVAGNITSAFAVRPAEVPGPGPVATASQCGQGFKLGPLMRERAGRLLDAVANVTGLSTEDVSAQRAEGSSFADIAAPEGVDVDEVVASALAGRSAALDELVDDGTISREQADDMLDRMGERLADRVTSTETGRKGYGGGRGFGGGKGGGQGFGPGACDECPNSR